MSNMFDPKTEKTSFLISNIRDIKIIAIILGLLIIIGLIFLFWGLGKKYNKLNNTTSINKTLRDDIEYTNKFLNKKGVWGKLFPPRETIMFGCVCVCNLKFIKKIEKFFLMFVKGIPPDQVK